MPPDSPFPAGGRPTLVDQWVGRRIRQRRTELALSEEKLAESLGVSFQQLRRYESAANRVEASRLFALARVLEVPVEYFFEDVSLGAPVQDTPALPASAPGLKRETIDLVRTYHSIGDPILRRRLLDFARSLAEEA